MTDQKSKHAAMGGGNLIIDFKNHFHWLKTKKTMALTYGFIFGFIFFTAFIAFSSSSGTSLPWINSILSIDNSSSGTYNSGRSWVSSDGYKFRFSSFFSYFLPNTSIQVPNFLSSQANISESNNKTSIGGKGSAEKGSVKNQEKKQRNSTKIGLSAEHESDDFVSSLSNCDLFYGNWVRDDSYPLYKPGSCSLIDEQFNCFVNGRPDHDYEKHRWKPNGCTLPRLNGSHLLELLRGKRLVFVGDSLNRNMWESLVCVLRNSVRDKKKVYEVSGKLHFRTEASYSFVFEDYECTVEFFATPFLVQEWEIQGKNGEKKERLRLDMIGKSADNYKDANILIFNTGHWWTHEKTSLGKDYYQEGNHVYSELNVLEAFRRALTTWGRWVDANTNATRTQVFFRGYSASHFSGGQWNSGGACDNETDPIESEAYLSGYPDKMTVLESVFKGMKTKVTYMNVTRMTDFRKDGHPSIYRKQKFSEEESRSPLSFQDCSHWCLPGVPDVWNEILYAQILLNDYEKQLQKIP